MLGAQRSESVRLGRLILTSVRHSSSSSVLFALGHTITSGSVAPSYLFLLILRLTASHLLLTRREWLFVTSVIDCHPGLSQGGLPGRDLYPLGTVTPPAPQSFTAR
ncbi:unnamed protein product [Arctogadus glacialis]